VANLSSAMRKAYRKTRAWAIVNFSPMHLSVTWVHSACEGKLRAFETLPDMLTTKDLEGLLQIDRKTIYAYADKRLIPYIRIESNIRFPKHQVMRWLEERSFQPRSVNGKGAKRQ
jgi:excisionase family DNA binding protein